MKTFEERYTAWIDGKLTGADLAAFERELEEHPEAEADKAGAVRLGGLLRQYGHGKPLANGDFFNHQLMARIDAEETRTPARRPVFAWRLPHLAWAGAGCLFIALAVAGSFLNVKPSRDSGAQFADLVTMPTPIPSAHEASGNAQVIDATSGDPQISVSTVHSEGDKSAILWVDGLDYLPAGYELR